MTDQCDDSEPDLARERPPASDAGGAEEPAELKLSPASALSAHLERQRGLLEQMLKATRDQRRCLVEGDMKGLEETNRVLGLLLERHADLQRQRSEQTGDPHQPASDLAWAALRADRRLPDATPGWQPGLGLQELRLLARELQKESRTNYLLACRGAQFANFSISLLSPAKDAGAAEHPANPSEEAASADIHDESSAGRQASPDRPHLMDRPA